MLMKNKEVAYSIVVLLKEKSKKETVCGKLLTRSKLTSQTHQHYSS